MENWYLSTLYKAMDTKYYHYFLLESHFSKNSQPVDCLLMSHRVPLRRCPEKIIIIIIYLNMYKGDLSFQALRIFYGHISSERKLLQ